MPPEVLEPGASGRSVDLSPKDIPLPGNRLSYLAILIFTVVLAVAFVAGDAFAPGGRRLAKIAGDDPPIYFDVSHALLFHQSFDLTREFEKIRPESDRWSPISTVTGHRTSPFPVGYSILAMPFLAIGTIADAIAGNPSDGFSRYAILFYCLTNVVLTGLGMAVLFTFLFDVAISRKGVSRTLANWLALGVTCAIFFGTSVGYYAFSEMSHAATFLAGSMFMFWWWRVRDREDVRSWMILGLLGGFLSIARWQDVFFTGAPLLCDLLVGFDTIRRRLHSRLLYIAAIAVCWLPQIVEWKFMFGKYLTVPQGGGIFKFPPPFVPNVLFSSEHGWFIWTPIAFLGVLGLVAASFETVRYSAPWIVVIALEVTLIASIPVTWHSGPAFGNRYMTSSAPLVGFGLMILLSRRRIRVALVALTAVFCIFSILFAIQFRLDLIPKVDRLTPAELFSDKFRMNHVRHVKAIVQQADDLITAGAPTHALELLQNVRSEDDRDVLAEFGKVYRVLGRQSDAVKADDSLSRLMASRLY